MEKGVSVLGVLLFIAFLLLALIGADYAFVEFYNICGDVPLQQCLDKTPEKPVEAQKNETVTAVGSFNYQKYSVNFTLNIPLKGGPVTGKVTGTCQADITGNYQNGQLSGKAFGSCNPFTLPIPGKAVFTGSVNESSKTVPITGTGSTAGFSKSGSLTLTYK